MSILISGGIFLFLWFGLAAIIGFVGLALFLWGLVPYHRMPAGRSRTSQYIKMSIGIVLLAAALFGLCILFPIEVFVACLAALAGIVVLCFAVPKRIMLPSSVRRRPFPAIIVGAALIVISIAYMAISGIALAMSIIKAILVT